MKKTKNKTQEILKYMQEGNTISSFEAFEMFGATRLSAVIFELRKKYNIKSIPATCIDRYGTRCDYVKYKLEEE